MTNDRVRPMLASILTTSTNTSRGNTPRNTPGSGSIPSFKRRVSFTNNGEPDQSIPERLEDLLEMDGSRPQNRLFMERKVHVEETVLHQTCQVFDIDGTLSYLKTQETTNIDAVSLKGFTALCLTSMAPESHFSQSYKIAESLLAYGASIYVGDAGGYSPLHWSAATGNIKLLELFLSSQNVLADLKSTDGETPLHRASRFGQLDCIELLLRHGASIHAYNKELHQPQDVAGFADGTSAYETTREAVLTCFASLRPSVKTLLLHHPDCNEHSTIDSHQESPQRITAILQRLHLTPNPMVDFTTEFPFASFTTVRRVHNAKYIDTLKSLHAQVQHHANGVMVLTPRIQIEVQGTAENMAKKDAICDTNFSRGTLRAALRGAGSVCHAVNCVVQGKYRNAFCIIRPPGHHAGWEGLLKDSVSCGFCILNNVMIGVQYALDTFPHIKRIAIIDMDAHHGNGTQDILKRQPRSNVLFVSLHLFGDGFYPGSGETHDLAHNIYNFPIAPVWSQAKEKGSTAFRSKVTQIVLPIIRSFQPDLILLSSGFDGCHHDIGNKQDGQRDGAIGLDLTPGDFHWATNQFIELANLCCSGRLVSVLEGGYGSHSEDGQLNLDTLETSAQAHVHALSGQFYVEPPIKTRSSGRATVPTHKVERSAKRRR